jgi:prepilin-type N-terminal cleavage/methylation domain-containing protein
MKPFSSDRPCASLGPRRRRGARGFTLIELMVSLVMGLLVAIAAVGLAKTATTTFFEEARISAVEASIRTASERFRNDLSRVAYMSTPNIQLDPKVARVPGTIGSPYRVPALTNLQGLGIEPGAIRSNVLSTANSETQQEVYVAGNLTSNDVYRGQWIQDQAGCGNTGGVKVRLTGASDPAVRRMFNGETTSTMRKQMTELVFTPGTRMNPVVAGKNYAVQVMDMRGCFQYMTICAVSETTEPDSVVLELAGDPAKGLLTPADLGGDVCGASLMEEVAVAPIGRVHWYIGPAADSSADGGVSADQFDLYRQLLAADGTTTIGPAEVIAEYAVDLKLGLFVDRGTGSAGMTVIDLEGNDTDFAAWASSTATYNGGFGPQRIRSVRYRMAFRAALADRRTDLPMASPAPYIARYNMNNGVDWSRVRTVMSEVALFNQEKATW